MATTIFLIGLTCYRPGRRTLETFEGRRHSCQLHDGRTVAIWQRLRHAIFRRPLRSLHQLWSDQAYYKGTASRLKHTLEVFIRCLWALGTASAHQPTRSQEIQMCGPCSSFYLDSSSVARTASSWAFSDRPFFRTWGGWMGGRLSE